VRSRRNVEQAAVVPHGGFAALQGLRDRGRLQPDQKVLIVGASAAVGSVAVQLGKAFGAEVSGVCSASKVDMVQTRGADHVIDYTRDDFADSGVRRRRHPLSRDRSRTRTNRPHRLSGGNAYPERASLRRPAASEVPLAVDAEKTPRGEVVKGGNVRTLE
jgi:hypothetical protein